MIEIGRLCIKIAGRDAGLNCVIVDILDDRFVLIDGETRRRRCNIMHLEPLKEIVKIKKNSSHEVVSKVLKVAGINARETKPKQKTERPRKKRKTPEQLREQKEERNKLRNIFKSKKKETGKEKTVVNEKKGESLEEKAGLVEKKEGTKTKVKKSKKDSKSIKK